MRLYEVKGYCDVTLIISTVRETKSSQYGPTVLLMVLLTYPKKISSDKASNLPKRDIRFILLK